MQEKDTILVEITVTKVDYQGRVTRSTSTVLGWGEAREAPNPAGIAEQTAKRALREIDRRYWRVSKETTPTAFVPQPTETASKPSS